MAPASDAAPATVSDAPLPPQVSAMLAQLRILLADSDTGALDLLEEMEPLVAGLPLARQLRKVSQQVERFDFDAALAQLDGLALPA